MRKLIIGVALGLSLPVTSAGAIEPPAAELTRSGHGPHANCVTTAGNAALEEAETQIPPPTGPEGQATVPSRRSCPPGQLLIVKSKAPKHHGRPKGAPEGGGSAETGYFYVEDGWEKPKTYEAWFSVQFSSPVVPENARPSAHTDMQDWNANPSCAGFKPKTLCTIELGWEKELSDQQEGYKGSQPFCYMTASNYATAQSGGCNIVLNVPEAEDPFEKHYYPTDGSPESRCGKPGSETSPCTGQFEWRVKQYKGAWWIWSNVINTAGGGEWIGRVSDTDWGHVVNGKLTKPFTAFTEEEDGGEVYDWPNAPVTPMGNGNKGGCTCATAISAIQLKRHRTTAEGGGTVQEGMTFNEPLNGVTWPQRYTAGQFSQGRTLMHLGG